jgi:hypothetical protein
VLIKSLQTGMYCRLQSIAAGSSGLKGAYAARPAPKKALQKRVGAPSPPPKKQLVQAGFPKAKRNPPPRLSVLGAFPSAATLAGASASSLVGSVIVCDVALREVVAPMTWTGAGEAAAASSPPATGHVSLLARLWHFGALPPARHGDLITDACACHLSSAELIA